MKEKLEIMLNQLLAMPAAIIARVAVTDTDNDGIEVPSLSPLHQEWEAVAVVQLMGELDNAVKGVEFALHYIQTYGHCGRGFEWVGYRCEQNLLLATATLKRVEFFLKYTNVYFRAEWTFHNRT